MEMWLAFLKLTHHRDAWWRGEENRATTHSAIG